MLVHATGGRSVLEVGTFVGISAAWMARGLEPAGHIDTLELDETHADMAEDWFAERGLLDRIQVHRVPRRQPSPACRTGSTTSATSTPTRRATPCTWSTPCGWYAPAG